MTRGGGGGGGGKGGQGEGPVSQREQFCILMRGRDWQRWLIV